MVVKENPNTVLSPVYILWNNKQSQTLRAASALLPTMCPLTTAEEVADMKDDPYINTVGAINYIATATCLDLAAPISKLTCYSFNPGHKQWGAVHHLLKYIAGTLDLKLTYAPNPEQQELFTTFADSDGKLLNEL